MFMVLAGILCMGVAAEDTYTLVNPANSTNYETVGVETGAEVVWVPFTDSSTTDTLSWYERKCATLSELPDNMSGYSNGVLFFIKSGKNTLGSSLKIGPENGNIYLVGYTSDIYMVKTCSDPFIITSGATTISSLKFDGIDSSSTIAGITVTGGSLTLEDVTVTNCTGGGVRVTGDGKINVSGSTTIIGNTANGKASNLYSESPINVTGSLTGKIGVDMTGKEDKVAATGNIDTDSVDMFSLDNNSGYKPTLNADKQLVFTDSGSTDPDPGESDQKTSSVGIKVDGSIDADNNKVTFRITTNVPQCIGDYIPFTGTVDGPSVQRVQSANKRSTYMLVFHNTLDSKLSIDPESLKLTVKSKEIDNSLYTVEYDNLTDGCTFELRVNLVELYNKGYYTLEDVTTTPPDVVLTFDAVPKEGRLSGQYTDTAYINYGPYSDESKLTPTVKTPVTVGLYTVTVFKYDQENQAKGLAGATFILNKVEGKTATPIATGTTDDNGYCVFSGLEAGNYELVESEAPEGYAKSDKSYSFTCDRDITVNFANVKLPHTGGIGYKLPVTIGIICVICGGAFIAVGRKKKNDK